MKKKLLLLFFIPASVLGINTACADNIFGINWIDAWYIQGSGAIVKHAKNKFHITPTDSVKLEYDIGGGAAASAGLIFCQQWRTEFEVAWRRNKENVATDSVLDVLDDARGHTQDLTLMINAFYDLPLWCCWGVYVGAGFGVAFNEIKFSSAFDDVAEPVQGKHHNTLLAWQAIGGITYDIMDCVTLYSQYRAFMTTKPTLSGPSSHSSIKADEIPWSHCLEFGLRLTL